MKLIDPETNREYEFEETHFVSSLNGDYQRGTLKVNPVKDGDYKELGIKPHQWENKLDKELEKILDKYFLKACIDATSDVIDGYSFEHRTNIPEVKQAIEAIIKKELTNYSDWLHENGYIDSDYYEENPKAVDRYWEKNNEKTLE